MDPSVAEHEAAPRKRRRWLRRLIVLLLALPLLVVLVILALPSIVTKERVRSEAVSALTKALGTCVFIDRVDYHPLTGVELFGVRICPPKGFERDVLTADRVALR